MSNEVALVFKTNGTVEGIYNDALRAFCPRGTRVRRASNVEFDESREMWVARLLDGTEIAAGPNRSDVLKEEVRIINEMILENKEVPDGTTS